MRLPTQKKILREDLKGAPNWVGIIIDTLNSFMESVYQSLNKNITLQDNIASFVKEIDYNTVTTYPTGQQSITFNNALKSRPIGVQVLQAYDKDSYTPAAGPVYTPWTENNGVITITTITGLDPDKSYLIRLLIY